MKNSINARTLSFSTETTEEMIHRGFPARRAGTTAKRAVVAPAFEAARPACDRVKAATEVQRQPGSFEAYKFSNDAGSRTYKVYVPLGESDRPYPMMVMLHGCSQSVDDFAADTQMNRLADEYGFIVVYPQQAAGANAAKCWNWFNPQDQVRGAGEPSLIAGIVLEVVQRNDADPRRIFVAGLSAGAAMAVVLGETYPELFAGVGAHSGLPYAIAHDIPPAMAAMKGRVAGATGPNASCAASGSSRRATLHAVPVIVFHGDRDHTVQPANGAYIVQQAHEAHGVQAGDPGLRVKKLSGVTPGGQRFSRAVHADSRGQARIESWTLHGAGHAWSGGHTTGSYNDAAGPDASAEMVRFFLALSSLRACA
ncbi:PHB depolymerase family esterase [Paucibacter sp. O1-1]|nr:PHB depolymerase family esterase [Paucibacter sp. O1-1]MDA3830219.1 PHB depolymerase family esterase [Paucibacter sp. O1-1]